MDHIERLTEYFKKFPGIGERQARRFVYFLLNENPGAIRELVNMITDLKKNISQCRECYRFSESSGGICVSCRDNSGSKILVVVEKDADLPTVQRSGLPARYFVLGNRYTELANKINKESPVEIILAFSLTPQSEYNESILKERLSSLIHEKNIKISTLGRGLSTGLELEYSDIETLKNALKNRQ